MSEESTAALDETTAKTAPAAIPAPAATQPAKDAKPKAVIVASGTTVPKADLTIVTEARTYHRSEDPTVPLQVDVQESGYPSGADIYLRTDPRVTFPADAKEVLTLGDNLQQANFWGFSTSQGYVNVGPAHPAYMAANLAFQRGFTVIEIVGLTDAEKERLGPAFAELPTHPIEPAPVSVSFS